jgi:hypothetical protein
MLREAVNERCRVTIYMNFNQHIYKFVLHLHLISTNQEILFNNMLINFIFFKEI